MKLKRNIALALAVHLFELEIDHISQSGSILLEDKYGEVNFNKFEDALTSDKDNEFNAPMVKMIADALQEDFASGYWKPTDEDIKNQSFYQYMMPTIYGGWIESALDKQMAMLTGFGIQQVLF